MPKRDSEYWKKRFEQIEQAQNSIGMECYADIERQFRRTQKELEGQIATWYHRFATNNGISLSEARRMLNSKELAELKWDVSDYIRYGEANAVTGEWMKQLENASARYHISRLESLKLQTQQSLEVMFGNQLDSIDSAMRRIYKTGYYRTAYEIQKGVGIGWDFATLDDRTISKVINKPWASDGKNFSDRVWANKQKLVNELNTTLTQNIILGQDPQKAIDAISSRLNVSKSRAGALVMTEEAAFSSAAQKDCFNELDVEEYEIVATLDSHTSEICQDMDGRHFPMSQWEVGATAPPFHVYCRSTTCPYFEDMVDVGKRAARNADGKTYYVSGDTTYKDWKKAFVDGDKSGLQETKSDDTITLKDSLQSKVDDILNGNSTDREELARKILQEYGVTGVDVHVKPMCDHVGYCSIQVDNGTMKVLDYNLNANDQRSSAYQVKTAFHEAYHASGNGYATDYGKMQDSRWVDMEETFAESTAHYMSGVYGIADLTPSYPDKLVKMLPRLKQLPEFSECSVISDFGKVAQGLRQAGGGSAWKQLSQATMRKKFDFGTYTQQYFPEIRKDIPGYVDKILENMPTKASCRASMLNDLEQAMKNIEQFGHTLSNNESIMVNSAVAVAMNRIGVK